MHVCKVFEWGRAGTSTFNFLEYQKNQIQLTSTSIWVGFLFPHFKKIIDDVTDVDLTDIAIFTIDAL